MEEENKLDRGNFFGYVDEEGNVIYIDLEEEDNVVIFPAAKSENNGNSGENRENSENGNNGNNGDDKMIEGGENNNNNDKMEIDENGINLESVSISLTEMTTTQRQIEEIERKMAQKHEKAGESVKSESVKTDKKGKKLPPVVMEPVVTNLSKYFLERTDPSPRINPCLMVRIDVLLHCYINHFLHYLPISILFITSFTPLFCCLHYYYYYYCILVRESIRA